MKPIFISIDNDLQLMIIPDTDAHVDGHPIITYSYSVYKSDGSKDDSKALGKLNALHLLSKKDRDYLGEIIFKLPGRLFEYKRGDGDYLELFEVSKLVEQLSHYRDNPELWELYNTDGLDYGNLL